MPLFLLLPPQSSHRRVSARDFGFQDTHMIDFFSRDSRHHADRQYSAARMHAAPSPRRRHCPPRKAFAFPLASSATNKVSPTLHALITAAR